MGLKYHTIIFVPHSRAQFRKLRVSNRQIRWAAVGLAVLTVGALFVGWKSLTTDVSLDEVASLRQENERLRTVMGDFENSYRLLERQLAEFEDKANSLAIVAGLQESPAGIPLRNGQGGGTGGDLEGLPPGELDLADLSRRSRELSGRLAEVDTRLDLREQLISSKPAILPAKGIITSRYGYRADPIHGRRAFHAGIDVSARPGSPVYASADGVVARAGRIGGLGRAVYLSHKFGYSTRYGHLSKIAVEPGQRVKRNDIIGYVGNTGRATGYHLHYEIYRDGRAQNPLEYVADL